MRFAMLSLALTGCLTYAQHHEATLKDDVEILAAELAASAVFAALPTNQSNGQASPYPYAVRAGAYLGGIFLLDASLAIEEKD